MKGPTNTRWSTWNDGCASSPPRAGRVSPVAPRPQLVEVMRQYLKAAGDQPTRTGLSSAIGTAAHGLVTDTAEFNALLEKTGKDTKAIEERIGHTSIKVEDIYTTIDSEQQADAVNAIPEALRLAMSLLPAGFETGRRADCGGGAGTPGGLGAVTQGCGRQEDGARQGLTIRKSPAETRPMSLRKLDRRRACDTTGFQTLDAMTCISWKLDLMSVNRPCKSSTYLLCAE